MSSHWNCDSDMIEADAIRAVYPRHTMKCLARAMGVPLDTARHWLFRRMSSDRRRELARVLLEEMDRQDVPRTALRRRLALLAAEEDRDGVAARVGRISGGAHRAARGGPPSGPAKMTS